jgi:hypothetical protein
MTDNADPRRSRRTTGVIVGVLVLVIAAVVVIGVLASGAATPSATSTPLPIAAGTTSPSASVPLSTARPTTKATSKPTVAPTKAVGAPQPTKSASITKPTSIAIKKELSAAVVKMSAVTGTADGPGEIGGPSVRFTIAITNSTGKSFALSNTVVNAYYGKDATPAVQLRSPGGKDFPMSVKDGKTATGVFVFNIPKASRSRVKVTVDTAVQNPVIAFQGAAPRQ